VDIDAELAAGLAQLLAPQMLLQLAARNIRQLMDIEPKPPNMPRLV
jgi:hypothetical protein